MRNKALRSKSLRVEWAPLTAFPAWCVLLCSHSGHLLFLWEAFLWGWEPGDESSWFWTHLIWSANLRCCRFAYQTLWGMMRLPFWNALPLLSQWPHLHPCVLTHARTNTPLVLLRLWSAAATSPLAPCHVHPCFTSAFSLFYELFLTLAHAPSVSGSCTGTRPKPYGSALMPLIAPPKESLHCCSPSASRRVGTDGQRIPPASLGLPGPGHMHMNGAVHLHLLQPLLHCPRSL